MTNEQFVENIRKDGIDILIDLEGHSSLNRLHVFAYKPAPVQVTWMSYPNTTELSAIDNRLTDSFVVPESRTDKDYSKKLIRLPNNFLCFSSLRKCPVITPMPSAINSYITFASLNIFFKVKCFYS